MIADADGFVVYGVVNMRAAAWTSTDGIVWKSLALAGSEGTPSAAAESDGATLLLGNGSTARCAHPDGEFMWRRAHGGQEWQPVAFDEALFCAGGFAHIAAGPSGFVVAGRGAGEQPFAWRSMDGLVWEDATAGLSFDAPPELLAATADEFLELGRGALTDARTTRDFRWTRVEAPAVPPAFNPNGSAGTSPAALLSVPQGLLAIYASDDLASTTAWLRQADGSWAEIQSPVQPGESVAGGAVIDGKPFVWGMSGGTAFLRTSKDLSAWIPIDLPAVGLVQGLAVFAGRTILVGAVVDAAGDAEQSVIFGLPEAVSSP